MALILILKQIDILRQAERQVGHNYGALCVFVYIVSDVWKYVVALFAYILINTTSDLKFQLGTQNAKWDTLPCFFVYVYIVSDDLKYNGLFWLLL